MGFVKNFYPCFLTLAMDIVGGKWKMVILWHLRNGILRFNEIRRLMPGITQKMLTQQLRELEDNGIVSRTVYPVVPPKVEYALTDEGKKLIPVLDMLCNWSTTYAGAHGISCGFPICSGKVS
jgi:Predicted transcriptional regulators